MLPTTTQVDSTLRNILNKTKAKCTKDYELEQNSQWVSTENTLLSSSRGQLRNKQKSSSYDHRHRTYLKRSYLCTQSLGQCSFTQIFHAQAHTSSLPFLLELLPPNHYLYIFTVVEATVRTANTILKQIAVERGGLKTETDQSSKNSLLYNTRSKRLKYLFKNLQQPLGQPLFAKFMFLEHQNVGRYDAFHVSLACSFKLLASVLSHEPNQSLLYATYVC